MHLPWKSYFSGVTAASLNLPSYPGDREITAQFLTGNFLHNLKSIVVNEIISYGLANIKAKESSSVKVKLGHLALSTFAIGIMKTSYVDFIS